MRFNFDTQLDQEFLINGYKEFIKKLFEPGNYYPRCAVLRDNLGERRLSRKINLNGITALGKSLRRQLFAKGGLEYASFLVKTLLKKPSYFPEAVAHAIKFDHFSAITKATLDADEYISRADRLYDRFAQKAGKVYERQKNNLTRARQRITAVAHETLELAEDNFTKLHKDFRSGAENAYSNLRERINRDLDQFIKGYCTL